MLMAAMTMEAQLLSYSLDTSDGFAKWTVSPERSMEDAVTAPVPGTVFTAYVEAGREACPEYGSNIYRVDETKYSRPYWYRTVFTLPRPLQADERLWLCFDNTNRYADFWFNGEKVSGTPTSEKDVSGHMLRSRFDVTRLLSSGGALGTGGGEATGTIEVKIYDTDQKKTRKAEGPYGVACSPSYLAGAGWDWIPYIPGRLAGITGHVHLEVTRDVRLLDPCVRTRLIPFSPDKARGLAPLSSPSEGEMAELTVIADVANASETRQLVTVSGTIMPGNLQFTKQVWVNPLDTAALRTDRRDAEALVVNQPRLWWPNGYGAPNLYECHLRCYTDGKLSDERTLRFGIRQYDYRIETNDVGYPVLQFYVNGQRVFLKGGNWGMSEYLLRCHGRQYETYIRLHRDMNFNTIRLWTGCVTDDEFYDYCDEQGIMVWNDFWLYVAFNDVVNHDDFKRNARDKVRRLRSHPSIALWCGANETHPGPDIDQALRMIVMEEDANERLYKSCSNQDGLSGSGWWKDLPPRHHFETSASNLAFDTPAYPYGRTYGYGMRSEIGMATFPQYESVQLFIPKEKQWPLPTDDQLKDEDDNVWNHHFFGKEASNAGPADYRRSVDERYGASKSLQEFCDKAQLVNLEDMRGMYEAWQDKMWNDAAGLLIWMSHPAYPSFVWQTYDYYLDPTGCYWGARKACEPQHVQWNCLTGSVKVVNTTSAAIRDATVRATVFSLDGRELNRRESVVSVDASDVAEAFSDLPLVEGLKLSPSDLVFIRLELRSADGELLSENLYWHNTAHYLDNAQLWHLPEVRLKVEVVDGQTVRLKNTTQRVSFANRLRLIDTKTGERVLPVIWSDNYVTLMPGEERVITFSRGSSTVGNRPLSIGIKPFGQKERTVRIESPFTIVNK